MRDSISFDHLKIIKGIANNPEINTHLKKIDSHGFNRLGIEYTRK